MVFMTTILLIRVVFVLQKKRADDGEILSEGSEDEAPRKKRRKKHAGSGSDEDEGDGKSKKRRRR